MGLMTNEPLTGSVYLGSTDDGFEIEGELAHVEVEPTDEDEVRLGIKVGTANGHDDATLYFSRRSAARAAVLLAAASIAEVELPA